MFQKVCNLDEQEISALVRSDDVVSS